MHTFVLRTVTVVVEILHDKFRKKAKIQRYEVQFFFKKMLFSKQKTPLYI